VLETWRINDPLAKSKGSQGHSKWHSIGQPGERRRLLATHRGTARLQSRSRGRLLNLRACNGPQRIEHRVSTGEAIASTRSPGIVGAAFGRLTLAQLDSPCRLMCGGLTAA